MEAPPSDPFTLSSCSRTFLDLVVAHQQITCLSDLSNPKSRPGNRASGVPLIGYVFVCAILSELRLQIQRPVFACGSAPINVILDDPHGPFVLFSARLSRFHGLRLCDLPSQGSFISHISRPLHLTNQKVSGKLGASDSKVWAVVAFLGSYCPEIEAILSAWGD